MPVQPSPESYLINSQSPQKRRKPAWRVVLGRLAWSRHTYERQQDDALKLLGSVSKGMQVGALAITADGQYVQVVGDHLTPLNTRAIAKAVANATKEPDVFDPEFSRDPQPWRAARKETPTPVVIVRKRRVAVMP